MCGYYAEFLMHLVGIQGSGKAVRNRKDGEQEIKNTSGNRKLEGNRKSSKKGRVWDRNSNNPIESETSALTHLVRRASSY
jgi:hypothetical protein